MQVWWWRCPEPSTFPGQSRVCSSLACVSAFGPLEHDAAVVIYPIIDRITCTYCSFGCLLCAFIAFSVYLFTALTWILVENNNCVRDRALACSDCFFKLRAMAPDSQRTAVPGLYLNAKYYLIGIISVSRLRWFGSESAEPHSLTGSLSASLLL